MRLKLHTKFLIPTTLVLVLVMGLATFVSYTISSQTLRKATEEQLQQISASTLTAIESWIEERKLNIITWAQQDAYRLVVKDGDAKTTARDAANQSLAQLQQAYGYYESIRMVDARGDVIASSPPEQIGKLNIGDREYFRASMQGKVVVSDVSSSRTTNKPIFVVSAPVREPNSEKIGGVLYGVIDLNRFTERFIDPVRVGRSGYVYVLNQEGSVLAHPDKANILKLDLKTFDFGREILARKNGVTIYTWQGAEKIVAYRTSQALGWIVGASATTTELMAPIKRLSIVNLLLTVGGVLLAAGVLFLLTRLLITRPLTAMAQVAHKLAEGDVKQQITHRSRDEIGMLAEAFRGFLGYLTEMAGAADRLSKGDLTVQVQARSEVDILSHSFQRVTETLQRMVSETQTLMQRAQEGQLKARGDATKFAGAYAEVIQGINAMLQAILTPIEEAASVLDQIASRDLTARIQGTYQGEYARIKKALNTAVHNLDEGFTQVASAAEQVASAAGQINSGSQSLASGASEQASSLEEVSSNLQELVAMSQQNTNNAHEVRQLAEQSHTSAEKGTASMQRLSVAIHKIKASADATAKIVKTIDDIAFQTNLLALNAAVEAARAGDAGKGFAVVADEVRNLAIRSAEAAKNTAQMLEESVQNAEAGVALHQEVLTNLEEITTGAQRGNIMMGEIATASDQQQQGIAQINVAVDQMNHVTQQTAANAQQAASTATELAGQAEALQRLLTVFNLTKKEATTRAWAQPTLLAPRPHPQASRTGKELAMGGQNSRSHSSSAPLRSEDIIPFDDEDGTTLQEF